MRYLKNLSTDPYFNMAFDEYALQQLSLDEPLFFLWQNRSAVIIGLNQNAYTEVDLDYLKRNNIALVRRVTGGGAVYHDLGNLNYTIVGRAADLNRDYPEYTRYILQALQALGVEAELSGRNDILVGGRKVSGYAKRVYKDRLMVHGTLMFDVDLEVLERALNPPVGKLEAKGIVSVRSRVTNLRECLPGVVDVADFKGRLERYLSCEYRDVEYVLQPHQLEEIARMARGKFATEDWTFRRSVTPHVQGVGEECIVTRKERLRCGTVEVTIRLCNGVIVSCSFGGDFIGNLSPVALEEALVGVHYEAMYIEQCLSGMDVQRYFDGATLQELLRLLCC
mgnify:CR=1 FL=1